MPLPSGTVTFLFTDVEGSTRLWERSEKSMQLALARHDAMLNEIFARNGGQVFKTVGDGFYVAFSSAPQGVLAALEAQSALAAADWPPDARINVRMALHSGAAELRDGEYYGQTLNRVARMVACGHGGQVLLSEAMHGLCLDALPPEIVLKNLGKHRLRDLGRAEAVYQLCHPGLPQDFPPLRSIDSMPNNLPQQLTSFVGRAEEIRHVSESLKRTRLLTIAGTGGAGKTRLALQAAGGELANFGDGVWVVELAAISEPSLVPQAVSDTFGLRDAPGSSVLDNLAEHLETKHLLMVLDNCEHLLDAGAQLAQTILTRCPQVTVLATSREALGIGGELIFRVPPLRLPNPKSDRTPEAISSFESVELFVSRAQAHRPEFSATEENAAAIASVCRSLDGIPLAIELAAARVRSMTVAEIGRRLDHRFSLLRGGSRTAMPRQQTLQSLIDWSYDLLSGVEKAMFSRLSVFPGGWSLATAEQICSGPPVDEADVFEAVVSLTDKSLIMVDPLGADTRHRLSETMRQYAADRLDETGDGAVWRDRHLEHFLSFAEQASPHLRGKDQPLWLDRLETEHDNLRAALTWAVSDRVDWEMGLRLCAAIWRFWYVRGHCTEGRHWCAAALAKTPEGSVSAPLATTLSCSGVFASIQGDYEASRTFHERSLSLRRELGDETGIAVSLNNLGSLAHDQGDYARAGVLHEESLALRRKLGDQQGISVSLNNLATVAHDQGDYDQARSMYQETLSIERSLSNPWGTAVVLSNLGQVAVDQGDYVSARAYLVECLEIRRFLGDRLRLPDTLDAFASLAVAISDPLRAARLWGASEALKKEIGSQGTTAERARREARITAARAEVDDAASFDASWAAGAAMTVGDAVEFALRS